MVSHPKEKNTDGAFEKRVPRRIVGLKREQVTGGWRQLHNMYLNNSYTSSTIVRMTKSRKMKWLQHVEHKGEIRNIYKFFAQNIKGKRSFGRSKHI
jgi:hypothetical protein